MEIVLAEQTISFLVAIVLGAVLALVYDVFRITRVAFPPGKVVVFVEDLLYFILCAGVTFLYLMGAVEGQVRVFLLIGELIGAVLYFCTLGRLVMGISRALIEGIKRCLRFLFDHIVMPIWRIAYRIVSVVLRPFRFFGRKVKKSAIKANFYLKLRRIVLYNQVTEHFALRQRKSNTEEPDDYGKGNKKKPQKSPAAPRHAGSRRVRGCHAGRHADQPGAEKPGA